LFIVTTYSTKLLHSYASRVAPMDKGTLVGQREREVVGVLICGWIKERIWPTVESAMRRSIQLGSGH